MEGVCVEVLATSRLVLPVFRASWMERAATDAGSLGVELSGLGLLDGPIVTARDWPNADFKEAAGLIGGLLRAAPGLEAWQRLIIERSTRQVVGEVGMKALPADGSVEIGYGVCESARGRGIATEAVGAMVSWALTHQDVRRVVAECMDSNDASMRVLAKCGFVLGRTEGAFVWWARD